MYKFIILFLLFFISPISASTGASSIELVSISSPFLPLLSSITAYLLFTVVYMYIVTLKEVNRKKACVIAMFVWLISLGFILYYNTDLVIITSSLAVCLLSYIFILLFSLRKN